YYIKQVLSDREFTFSAEPGGPALQGITSAFGALDLVDTDKPPFQIAGLDLSGTIRLTAKFDAVLSGSSAKGLSQVEVQLFGPVDGPFATGDVTGNFSVTVGSNSGSSAGVTVLVKDGVVTVPDWGFSLDGRVQVGSVLQLDVTNVTVTHTQQGGKGKTVLNGSAKVTLPGANKAVEIFVG